MLPLRGRSSVHESLPTIAAEQVFGHKDIEYRLHSVKTKSLGRFVADDVRNAAGHLFACRRHCLIFRRGSVGGGTAHVLVEPVSA